MQVVYLHGGIFRKLKMNCLKVENLCSGEENPGKNMNKKELDH